MEIIDAHIHFRPEPRFDELAEIAGHINSDAHLRERYAAHDIVHAVVMGNRSLQPSEHNYPDYLSYCIGLDRTCFKAEETVAQACLVEKHLQRNNCVGLKLYPGYNHFYIYDSMMDPFYQLAMQYKKPVSVHTGLTATSNALLKYSHPMVVDEAAVRYPQVQFVMCHIGNPWLVDSVAIMMKNENVAADLSGLLEGRIENMPDFLAKKSGYINLLKGWLEYLDDYDRLLYGTDWPLANISNYIEFVAHMIPEKQQDKVFFGNANRIYHLGL